MSDVMSGWWKSTLSVLASLAVVAGALVAPPHDSAAAYSVVGKVTHVADGDTFDVDVPGDGKGEYRVRIIGIQAPEIGECGAAQATNRLEDLIDGKNVTLIADDESSTGLNNRKLRFVEINGVDVGLALLEEGLAFAFPSDKEPSRNEDYLTAAAEAADSGIGLWDTNRCGNGPKQSAGLAVVAQWDADGNDHENVNGEWVRITNSGSSSLSLNGWQVRDSALNIYDFPASASIAAGGSVTLYVGSGTNTSKKFYWGQSEPVFDNDVGDTVVLLDPDGDHRAWFQYPCVVDCFSSLTGKLAISANFDAEGNDNSNPNGEWINVTNISERSLSLSGLLLESWPYSYEFPKGTSLGSGKRLRIYIGSGSDTQAKQFWGHSSGILNNSGDTVRIRTFDGVVIVSASWPCDPCAELPDVVIKSVQWDAPGNDATNPNGEWVLIKNRSDGEVDLRNWKLTSPPYHFDFKTHTKLGPNETVKVFIGDGTNGGGKRFWGLGAGILGNSGDQVMLMSPARDLVDCADWGGYNCSPTALGSPLPKVEMYVHYDAEGADGSNPNGEWVTLVNTGNSSIDLSDSALVSGPHHIKLGKGTKIGPGKHLRVFVGSGSKTSTKRFWGKPGGILANSGDQVTLTQGAGQPALTFAWPCSPCGPIGKLKIVNVNYDAPGPDNLNPNGEWIKVKNTGSKTVDFRDWTLLNGNHQLTSKKSRPIAPGDKVTIFIGQGSWTDDTVYWGNTSAMLVNSGDKVRLQTPYGDIASCFAWGDKSC